MEEVIAVLGRDHKLARFERLGVLQANIVLANRHQQDPAPYESRAMRLAEELVLDGPANSLDAAYLAWFYQYAIDDPKLAEAMWKRSAELESGDFWRVQYAGVLLGKDGPEAAISEIAKAGRRSAWGRAIELQLVALQGTFDGQTRPRAEWKESRAYEPQALLVPMILGDFQEAREVAEEWKKSADEWKKPVIDYVVAQDPTTTPRIDLQAPNAHIRLHVQFCMAIRSLQLGNRSTARTLFQSIVSNARYSHPTYVWAASYLDYMQRNPSWPNVAKSSVGD